MRRINRKKAVSVSIIGGADGPTSIFLAGKVGKPSIAAKLVIGVLAFAAAMLLLIRVNTKNEEEGML